MLDVEQIRAILPHRYPFLLVDRILELEDCKYAVGLKNVTVNEYFFEGHFPDHPVMPGVLVAEAMAQVAGVLLYTFVDKGLSEARPYFVGLDKVRFRQPVVPGDQLITEAVVLKTKGRTGKVQLTGRVDGKVVAEGEFTFVLTGGEYGEGESST